MSCRGVCNRYKPEWEAGKPRYTDNSCRCTVCETWLDTIKGTTNFRCNCCNGKVRVLARTGRYRRIRRQ